MKSLHILISLLFVTSPLFSQIQSELYKQYHDDPNWEEGVITKKDGQQVLGLIQYKLKDENQAYRKILFIAIDGMEKQTYVAEDLESFNIALFRCVSYKTVFYQIVHEQNRIALLKRLTFDPSKLRTLPTSTSNAYGLSTNVSHNKYDVTFFLRKDNAENLYEVVDMKKKLSTYFSDCESLALKIRSGTYKAKAFSTDPINERELLLIEVVNAYEACK